MPKKAKRPTRRFTSRFHVTVEIEISERLLEEVSKPDWQSSFYDLKTPQDVADHIAYNVARSNSAKSLDGFAHIEDGDVVVHGEHWDED